MITPRSLNSSDQARAEKTKRPSTSIESSQPSLAPIDLGRQLVPFWPTRKFWHALSRKNGEWDRRLFLSSPFVALTIAASAPIAYTVAISLGLASPSRIGGFCVSLLGGGGLLAIQLIKGAIERRVRKQLVARKAAELGEGNP